jgi:hypothetical protein
VKSEGSQTESQLPLTYGLASSMFLPSEGFEDRRHRLSDLARSDLVRASSFTLNDAIDNVINHPFYKL